MANDKKCEFCDKKMKYIDYKNLPVMFGYITYYAKIKPRYYTGVCLKHQKMLARAIKRARHLALLPFVR